MIMNMKNAKKAEGEMRRCIFFSSPAGLFFPPNEWMDEQEKWMDGFIFIPRNKRQDGEGREGKLRRCRG